MDITDDANTNSQNKLTINTNDADGNSIERDSVQPAPFSYFY